MTHFWKLVTICSCLAAATMFPLPVQLPCSVSHSGGQTTFSIPDRPELEDDSCQYSWCNKTGNVIANQFEAAAGLVLKHSIRSLVTSGCQDMIRYEGRCGPKWEKLMAQCTFPCVKKPVMPGETPGQPNAAVNVGWCFLLCSFPVLLMCF